VKKLLDIKKDLPKLGEEQLDGSVVIDCEGLGVPISFLSRPNYDAFKGRDYNSEPECVSMLLGCNAELLWRMVKRREKPRVNGIEKTLKNLVTKYGKTENSQLPNFLSDIADFVNNGVLYCPDGKSTELAEEVRKKLYESGIESADETDEIISSFENGKKNGYSQFSSLLLEIMRCLRIARIKGHIEGEWSMLESDEELSYDANQIFQSSITYNTLSFLNWAKENSYAIPEELAFKEKNGILSWVEDEQSLRSDQEDKIKCQEIAQQVWEEYPILDIKHMKQLPDIIKRFRKLYEDRTVHNWLSEVAPDRAKKKGARSPQVRSHQKTACRKLNIPI